MKFGVVNKWTILNRFVLHTLQRNITHLAVITRKTNIKLGVLKGGKLEKNSLVNYRRFIYAKNSELYMNQRWKIAITGILQKKR